MSITALEIKQRTFTKTLRGYDVAEVTAFLNMMANEWEHQVVKIKDLERDLRDTHDKLKHYQRIEATLHETLQTARDNAEQRLENARRDASNKLEKAEIEADNILQEARQQRQQIKQNIMKLLERRDEIIQGISSYLDVAQKSLDNFSKDNTDIYSLPQEDESSVSSRNSKKADKTDKAESAKNKQEGKSSGSKKQEATAPGVEDLDDLLEDID